MAVRAKLGPTDLRRCARLWFVAPAVAFALAACGGSAERTTTTGAGSYQTLVNAGAHLLRAGNASAAEQLFQQAVALEPAGAVAHYDLGVIFQQRGDRRAAIHQYTIALLSNPRYVPALYNKAILFSATDAPLAIFYYRKIIALQPDSPTAFLNLGLLESQTKGLYRVALRDLTRAVRLRPSLRDQIPPALWARLRKRGTAR